MAAAGGGRRQQRGHGREARESARGSRRPTISTHTSSPSVSARHLLPAALGSGACGAQEGAVTRFSWIGRKTIGRKSRPGPAQRPGGGEEGREAVAEVGAEAGRGSSERGGWGPTDSPTEAWSPERKASAAAASWGPGGGAALAELRSSSGDAYLAAAAGLALGAAQGPEAGRGQGARDLGGHLPAAPAPRTRVAAAESGGEQSGDEDDAFEQRRRRRRRLGPGARRAGGGGPGSHARCGSASTRGSGGACTT